MNPYEEAAQSMMQAGIGSLSGNTINKPPLFDPRENYIRETHDLNSPTNVINRKIQDFNNLKKSYEGTGMVPQTFPNWVIQDPDASGMMNTWGRYNKGSMFGTPIVPLKLVHDILFGEMSSKERALHLWRAVPFNNLLWFDMPVVNNSGLSVKSQIKNIMDLYGDITGTDVNAGSMYNSNNSVSVVK